MSENRDGFYNIPEWCIPKAAKSLKSFHDTALGELSQRSVVQVLFGAGSGGGILAITAFNSILAVFATLWLQSHCPPCVCYAIMRTTSPKP